MSKTTKFKLMHKVQTELHNCKWKNANQIALFKVSTKLSNCQKAIYKLAKARQKNRKYAELNHNASKDIQNHHFPASYFFRKDKFKQ